MIMSSSLSHKLVGGEVCSQASRAPLLGVFFPFLMTPRVITKFVKNLYCVIISLKGNSLFRATINMLIHFGLLLNFRFHILKSLRWVISQLFILYTSWILTRFFYFPSILESEIIIDDGQFGIHSKWDRVLTIFTDKIEMLPYISLGTAQGNMTVWYWK